MTIDFDALKATYGDELWTKEIGPYTFVFRCPSEAAHDACIGRIGKTPEKVGEVSRALCRDAVVYPPPKELAEIFAKRPGIATALSGDLLKVAAEEAVDGAKKLGGSSVVLTTT